MAKAEYILDAEGKAIGRVASEVAVLLGGKTTPDFERNLVSALTVKIINASKVKVINDKLTKRYHKHYTGMPGGLIKTSLATTAAKKGYSELIRMAVAGMLPNNKLKPIRLKNLIISE